jgi:hypothetical protein
MRRYRYRLVGLLALCSVGASGAVAAQEPAADSATTEGPSFWHAAAGVATANWITWAYNWYVQRRPWANVGTQSWGQNLREGFVWDNDSFFGNELLHPYHGSFYHSSARASGYGFWASFPFVAAGSASWELFGENITGSLNDLINTTFGGIALGEVTYRLSTLLGSRPGQSRAALGRELGAFVLSPMTRVQGLLQGGGEQPAALAGSQPDELASLALGRRSGHPFVELAVRYGSPFEDGPISPYDAFEFRLQISPDPEGAVRHVGISGLLARHTLSRSARSQAVVGVFQHFDYEDLTTLEFSGHSVSGGVLYQRWLGQRNRMRLGAHLEGIMLGGISSDYGLEWRRTYDLGPGAGARLGASLVRDGREWLRLDGRWLWLHSIHGSNADHIATFLRVGCAVPLKGALGLGGDLALATRHSSYGAFPSVRQQVPQMRAYLTWVPY